MLLPLSWPNDAHHHCHMYSKIPTTPPTLLSYTVISSAESQKSHCFLHQYAAITCYDTDYILIPSEAIFTNTYNFSQNWKYYSVITTPPWLPLPPPLVDFPLLICYYLPVHRISSLKKSLYYHYKKVTRIQKYLHWKRSETIIYHGNEPNKIRPLEIHCKILPSILNHNQHQRLSINSRHNDFRI